MHHIDDLQQAPQTSPLERDRNMSSSDKRAKVKKGWLAVQVGLEGEEDVVGGGLRRFNMPISHLHHPLFAGLLDKAHEIYGYNSAGPLRLPCSVDDFLHVRWLIEREAPAHFPPQNQTSFSLSSC